jgi:hypothetical protein
MTRRALIIGIDDYTAAPLSGCVNDARAVAQALRTNADGSPNFDVLLLTSDECVVSKSVIQTHIDKLFSRPAECAFFYFAGHGYSENERSFIVQQDHSKGDDGFDLQRLLQKANQAHSNSIHSSIIVLDSCNSGGMGSIAEIETPGAMLGSGITIMSACRSDEAATEYNGNGLFTGMFVEALMGSASDILGRTSSASIYASIDSKLGDWEQRPLYKANVQRFNSLRQSTPRISPDILRRLPLYFPEETSVYKLDPSYEPDRENVAPEIKMLPVSEENTQIFAELQLCNRHGLVVPVGADHMFFAAINSAGCRLTALGAHYRRLAQNRRI